MLLRGQKNSEVCGMAVVVIMYNVSDHGDRLQGRLPTVEQWGLWSAEVPLMA